MGIDVSKQTLDVSAMIVGKPLGKQVPNNDEGYFLLPAAEAS